MMLAQQGFRGKRQNLSHRESGKQLDADLASAIHRNPQTLCTLLGLKGLRDAPNESGFWIINRITDGKPGQGCIDPEHLTILSIGSKRERFRIYDLLNKSDWEAGRDRLAEAYHLKPINGAHLSNGRAHETTPPSNRRPPANSDPKKPRFSLTPVDPASTPAQVKEEKRLLAKFLASRPGIGAESFAAARGYRAYYCPNPKKSFALSVYVLPAYRLLPSGKPYGSAGVLYPEDGREFRYRDKNGNPKSDRFKNLNTPNGGDGIAVVGSLKRFREAAVVWLCEGASDALALDAHLPQEQIAVAVSHGAGTFSQANAAMFAGKTVRVIYDVDQAGEDGRKKVAAVLKPVAAEWTNWKRRKRRKGYLSSWFPRNTTKSTPRSSRSWPSIPIFTNRERAWRLWPRKREAAASFVQRVRRASSLCRCRAFGR